MVGISKKELRSSVIGSIQGLDLKGLNVFPVKPDKTPSTNWKSVKKGNYDITTLLRYGIITGKENNICVIDCDLLKEKDKETDICGVKYFAENFGDIETFTVKSKSGGLHYYFKFTEQLTNTSRVIKTNKNVKIDVRTEGGYIVGPTSEGYTIINDVPIIDIPEQLLSALILKGQEREKTTENPDNKTVPESDDVDIYNYENMLKQNTK